MSRRHPSAWQNFWWDVEEWIHRWTPWIALVLLLAFVVGFANAEDLGEGRDWLAQTTEEDPLENERCYAPYAPDLFKEFEVQNVAITVHWYDSKEELVEELGAAFGDRDFSAASDCEKKPEFNISYCDIYVVRPTSVDDDATMSVGHEVLHGLLGAYHD